MLKNELGRYFVEVWPVLWQGRCWEGVSSIIRGVAHCNLHSKYIFWGIHSPCSRHHTLATLITLHFVWFIVFKLCTEGLLKGTESMQIVVRVIKMRPQFRCRGKMLSGSKVPTQPVTVHSRPGSYIRKLLTQSSDRHIGCNFLHLSSHRCFLLIVSAA